MVQEAGLELGIQLLPGMPGSTPGVFIKDAELAWDLRPSCLRFYPCLVPAGTVLARWLEEGRYTPWSIEETTATLGRALARAWEANVPVIRLSVAPEPAFDASILAGPRHPALGALIQAEALLVSVQKAMDELGTPPKALLLPRSCQGFMYGERASLKPRWAALGLGPERIFFTDGEQAELRG
jgi:histone acetyltransferase (RNA polymerase elongator complex component)